jgi:nucleotide-binding universal stress UspA family protein
MFRTLVVPLDGSPLAERAIPYATRLAQVWQARVVLVQAVQAPAGAYTDGLNWERLQVDLVDEARDYLADVAEGLSGQVVFVVYARPGEAPPPVFSPPNARLLVPQDGSDYDAPALRTALDMLGADGEIVLVSVVAPPEEVVRDTSGQHVLAFVDQQEEARTREARDYLASVAEPLQHGPGSIDVTLDVRVGDPASGISMAAIDHQADLIVMATHGRTGIQRAVLGSVAGTVLRAGPTPVLLVHLRGAPTDAAPAELTIPVEMGAVPTF